MIKENCYWYEYDNDMGARIPYCKIHSENVLESCDNCRQYHSKFEETKADVFRSMSDEEMAEYINLHTAEAMWCNSPPENCPPHEDCELCILEWLKSPANKEINNGKT